MTTRAEREPLLQGQDLIANAVISYLLARGWSGDRILKNVAQKVYSPNRALVRVELDSENQQYWVTGEYVSMGENVLSGCFAYIKTTSSLDEIGAEMGRFLQEAETRIGRSFAVRFLGDKPKGTSARV